MSVRTEQGPEPEAPCPCGSGAVWRDCCGPLLAGRPAADARALMRSRYSAWVLGRHDHLLASWHPDTRPQRLEADPEVTWLGLSIKGYFPEGDQARVSFVARLRVAGRVRRIVEDSRFVRQDGHWYYVDGR